MPRGCRIVEVVAGRDVVTQWNANGEQYVRKQNDRPSPSISVGLRRSVHSPRFTAGKAGHPDETPPPIQTVRVDRAAPDTTRTCRRVRVAGIPRSRPAILPRGRRAQQSCQTVRWPRVHSVFGRGLVARGQFGDRRYVDRPHPRPLSHSDTLPQMNTSCGRGGNVRLATI